RPTAEMSMKSSRLKHQPSELVGSKRIAVTQVRRLKPFLEPADALCRAAMGKSVGHDVSGCALLQPVVADCGGGGQAFLDIALFQDFFGGIRLFRPDACEAIGLKLHADRKLIRLRL